MAGVVRTDGFDSYNGVGAVTSTAVTLQSAWTMPVTTSGLALVTGLDGTAGTQALQFTSGSQLNAQRTLANPTRAVGSNAFRMKWTAFPNNTTLLTNFCLKTGSTFQFGIRVNTDGTISAYRLSSNTAGTLLGTSPSVGSPKVVLNTIHHLAIVWTLSTTVGAITVYLDGVAILTLSGVNNANAGAGTTADTFDFEQSFGNASVFIVDDYYETDDAVFAGQAKVIPIRPNADTATKDFTPDTGTANFSRVNENLINGDTSYVQASTVGNHDLYANGGLGFSPSAILAVQVSLFAEKTDTASRSVAVEVKSNTTTSVGPDVALIQSYQRIDRCLTTDPDTSANWTNGGVSALLFGPKVTV
jgi:hypothetical protein